MLVLSDGFWRGRWNILYRIYLFKDTCFSVSDDPILAEDDVHALVEIVRVQYLLNYEDSIQEELPILDKTLWNSSSSLKRLVVERLLVAKNSLER